MNDENNDSTTRRPEQHYNHVADVYAELGRIEPGLMSIGNADFTGWYRSRSAAGDNDGSGRPWVLADEFPTLRGSLDRCVYATTSYTPKPKLTDAWDLYHWDRSGERPSRVWSEGSSPTPSYADTGAIAPFADIDLESEYKHKRPDGDLETGPIEDALGEYINAFADLAGGREHVYALDSVGGAYVMVSPTATKPLARHFDGTERGMVFDELTDRLNAWLDDLRAQVNEDVPAVEGVFEADLVNNVNRLYKAPMSVHKSLDGVVTPLDVDSPDYDYTPIEDVDDGLIDESVAWAQDFTDGHEDAVGAIVAAMWPDYSEGADGWKDALESWVDDKHKERIDNERSNDRDLSAEDIPDDLETTDDMAVVWAAIEGIDVQDLARSVADDYDTDAGRDPPRFDPGWRTSDSGTSCFAYRNKWYDITEGGGGGPLALIARDRGLVRSCDRTVKGDDFWVAVNELRKEGYHIPRFRGHDGQHADALRLHDDTDDEEEETRQFLRSIVSGNDG